MVDEHGQRIREFLLGFAMNASGSDGPALHHSLGPSSQDVLRRELDRHTPALDAEYVGHDADIAAACARCCQDRVQPCDVLRLLAVPYASHPAYRPEWRPSAPRALGSGTCADTARTVE